jgi:hypothetical protein
VRHISNPNTTSRTPDTNTADKLHHINSPFHQKACHAPAMKSKEGALKHKKKYSTPQQRIQKPQVAGPGRHHLNKERRGKHSQTLSALTTGGRSTKITLLPHNPAEGI